MLPKVLCITSFEELCRDLLSEAEAIHYGLFSKWVTIPVRELLGVEGRGLGFLYVHVLELAALEHLTALQALDKLRIVLTGDDLHAGMAARLLYGTAHGWDVLFLRIC
jgi:hypothetical protein